MFFTAKTHKDECPFRVVVTEKGSWQGAMSRYLFRNLSNLLLDDPFSIANSDTLVHYLKDNATTRHSGFSLDVEDLFYSIPHNSLFAAVKECIEKNGTVSFQNQSALHLESFLELLAFYLTSTFVSFNGKYYLQKKGICIGSCVAPVLCDIFLSQCDRAIAKSLSTTEVARVYRYVDDYLILLNKPCEMNNDQQINDIKTTFMKNAQGLKFTYELPTEKNTLQFLDLQLIFLNDHTCWKYKPRTKKKLLQYESAHSKLTKRAIVNTCLSAALKKSCDHKARESFDTQVERLKSSGYPHTILSEVVENMISSKQQKEESKKKNRRPAVMPYIHRLSHNIKKWHPDMTFHWYFRLRTS